MYSTSLQPSEILGVCVQAGAVLDKVDENIQLCLDVYNTLANWKKVLSLYTAEKKLPCKDVVSSPLQTISDFFSKNSRKQRTVRLYRPAFKNCRKFCRLLRDQPGPWTEIT